MVTQTDYLASLDLTLGQTQAYVDVYSPSLLQSIPRALARQKLPQSQGGLRFLGVDIWTAYELSWLNFSGKPCVAIAEITVPADSPNIIESKSFKYYLNSFNQTKFQDLQALQSVIERDLFAVVGGHVMVSLHSLEKYQKSRQKTYGNSACLDDLTVEKSIYLPDSTLLQVVPRQKAYNTILHSHLLKSNCPVTGQPDWATLWVGYSGPKIVPESLLAYIVSYRQHQDFHENCVEKIFTEIDECCKPENLWVYARYTRRGGLDINPFRSKKPMEAPRFRGERQ